MAEHYGRITGLFIYCVLVCDLKQSKQNREDINISRVGESEYEIDLKAGDEITLYAGDYEGGFNVEPVQTRTKRKIATAVTNEQN